MPDFTFPQYRKYSNNLNYFKIISLTEFEENSFIGKKAFVKKHSATILPDRNFINDLLIDTASTSIVCTKEEYDSHL